ncbi:MAG TPA: hypothetical protein VEZ11_06680 [Thermoanaerobaculia bacterium]|nr:hypothetical protein [Thermoanaerobaculia bacterium]
MNPTGTQPEIGAAVGITDQHVRNVQRSPAYIAAAERFAAEVHRRALAMLRQALEPAARKLLRMINDPRADQVTVGRLEVTGKRRHLRRT